MKKVSVKVTGSNTVDGHKPGETFHCDATDPRLRAWERGGAVTVQRPVVKKPALRKK